MTILKTIALIICFNCGRTLPETGDRFEVPFHQKLFDSPKYLCKVCYWHAVSNSGRLPDIKISHGIWKHYDKTGEYLTFKEANHEKNTRQSL